MSAKPSVRERFSLEFVSADAEVAALKGLLGAAGALPELVLFDETAPEAPAAAPQFAPVEDAPIGSSSTSLFDALGSSDPTNFEPSAEADPVNELRMLFGSVNR